MQFNEYLNNKAATEIPDYTTVGIDIGSRQAKAVLLHKKELYTTLIPTGFFMQECANTLIENLLSQSGLKRSDIDYIVVTGYGRVSLKFDDIRFRPVTEIACHGMGAHYLGDDVKTIIDIGGQDSKAIRIDPNDGKVINFAMNDKCAAGTGRFLEKIATVLGYDTTEMGPESLKSTNPVNISSVCVVFAESEVVSNRAKGVPAVDIAAGIHKSVAKRVYGLLQRVGIESNVLFTGGVSNNVGMLKAFEDLLGITIAKTKLNTVFAGALGAAIYAADYAKRGLSSLTIEDNLKTPELDLESFRKAVKKAEEDYINHTAGKKKYVAFTCTYTPMELLASANVAYWRLLHKGTPEELSAGETLTQSMFCDLTKSLIGGFIKNEREFKATDKVYSFFTCGCMKSTIDAINNLYRPAELFNLQKRLHDEDGVYDLIQQLKFFKKDLEELTGETISEETINENIKRFNKAKKLLNQISAYRKADRPLISGKLFHELVAGYYKIPITALLPELEKILTQLKNLSQLSTLYQISETKPECSTCETAKKQSNNRKIKLMLAGGIIADGDDKVVDILEKQLGVDIVVEDNCTGLKPLSYQIAENGSGETVYENIARGYFNKAPCARMFPINDMLEYTVNLAKEYKADGVLLYYLKFCPCYSMAAQLYKNIFQENNIPLYMLSGDYSQGDEGQIKTRLEAFIEMLKELRDSQ